MYVMGMIEFRRYMRAEERLQELRARQQEELQNAYDDIHPTRVAYDYERCETYSESLNVEDYAIWLVEIQQTHKKQRKYWIRRANAFNAALEKLSEEKQEIFKSVWINKNRPNAKYRKVQDELRNELAKVVSSTPMLQRKRPRPKEQPKEDYAISVEEWDKMVDAMPTNELYKDYIDTLEGIAGKDETNV